MKQMSLFDKVRRQIEMRNQTMVLLQTPADRELLQEELERIFPGINAKDLFRTLISEFGNTPIWVNANGHEETSYVIWFQIVGENIIIAERAIPLVKGGPFDSPTVEISILDLKAVTGVAEATEQGLTSDDLDAILENMRLTPAYEEEKAA